MKRMDLIKSMEVIGHSPTIEVAYIPINKIYRDRLYESFKDEGITLPIYSKLKRKGLNQCDLLILLKDHWISFRYNGKMIHILCKKGFIFDGASVPKKFVMRSLVKIGPKVLLAALIHDTLFALQPDSISYDDANNIFSALLRYKGVNKFTIGLYCAGVRSFIGKRIYKSIDPSLSWMKEFVEFDIK
jgi:hypothetical protein